MNYPKKILVGLLPSLLASCAMFDEDGLSLASEKASLEDLQGCFYSLGSSFETVYENGYKSLYYKWCKSVCIVGDTVSFSNYKIYTDKDYSKTDSDRQPESSTESAMLTLLEPAAHGAFYYNVKIGKEDYYFENVNGVRSLETRNDSKYVASEDAVCESF
jgi:hypothetical protein